MRNVNKCGAEGMTLKKSFFAMAQALTKFGYTEFFLKIKIVDYCKILLPISLLFRLVFLFSIFVISEKARLVLS